MKNFLIISILLCAFSTIAQTPITMVVSEDRQSSEYAERDASAINPYLGAKVSMNLSGEASQSILVSGRAMFIPVSGFRYAVPFMTNVNLTQFDSLRNRESGLSLGAYPWYRLTNSDNQLRLFLHGAMIYSLLDKSDINSHNQFRTYAGIEAHLYSANGGLPITLSVAPEIAWNVNDVSQRTSGIGFTGVIPIINKMGLLIEGLIPLDNEFKTGVSLGIIVNAQSN